VNPSGSLKIPIIHELFSY